MTKNKTQEVTGKLIYTGELELLSPLLIGKGEKEEGTDIVVLKNERGLPFIPATSLVGALRHYSYHHTTGNLQKILDYFWGSSQSSREFLQNSKQSALYIRDLELAEKDLNKLFIRVRDGVAIDNCLGIAEEKKKFEYEVVEPGVSFQFYMEITLRRAYDRQDIVAMAELVLQVLKEGGITLGAKTTRGLGRCRLDNIQHRSFIFMNREDVVSWLNGQWELEEWKPSLSSRFEMFRPDCLVVDALFSIKNSLMVRSYSGDPAAPDAVHICSRGTPVLPGSSLAGALRARAERIVNTFVTERKSSKLIRPLFGWADDKGKGKKKYKSRVLVEETPVESSNTVRKIQTRIKIDRFTGGVLKAHLFEEMPLWPKNPSEKMVRVKIKVVDCKDYEAGLLLLVLKDLWNGDLPVGGEKNVGRGVLQGLRADISINGKKVVLTANLVGEKTREKAERNKLSIKPDKDKEFLEKKVLAFQEKCKEVLDNEA